MKPSLFRQILCGVFVIACLVVPWVFSFHTTDPFGKEWNDVVFGALFALFVIVAGWAIRGWIPRSRG